MKPFVFLPVMLSVLCIFLLSCAEQQTIAPEKFCQADSDCVPASCCHATDAVAKGYAPNCEGAICTMECAPGTLDCGQGEIQCIQNECTVVFEESNS